MRVAGRCESVQAWKVAEEKDGTSEASASGVGGGAAGLCEDRGGGQQPSEASECCSTEDFRGSPRSDW